MAKKYLTASSIATWVRCHRMFYYSQIYPDHNGNQPILLEGISLHDKHEKLVSNQKRLIFLIGLLILIVFLVLLLFR